MMDRKTCLLASLVVGAAGAGVVVGVGGVGDSSRGLGAT